MANNSDRKKRNKFLLKLLFGVSAIALFVSAVGFGLEIYNNGQGESFYDSLSVNAISQEPSPMPSAAPISTDNLPSEGTDAEESPPPPAIDFETLQAQFPELVAWIKSDGTVLDYPVMQAGDNYHYLSRLPDGQSNKMGSIFLDYRNSSDFSDKNLLLYGHMMSSGNMFGTLNQYSNQEYYEEHPTMQLYTAQKNYTIELIAGYIVNSAYEVPPMSFDSDEAFESYVSDIKRRSVFESEVSASGDDRLISLCTCDYSVKNGRLIVVGKLVEAD